MTNPLIGNYISCSENALKLTYSNVEFQNFPGEDPRFQGREAQKTAPRGEILYPPPIVADLEIVKGGG